MAGINANGRHRSVDFPQVLRTPPDSTHRVRASYHTPGKTTLAFRHETSLDNPFLCDLSRPLNLGLATAKHRELSLSAHGAKS